MSDETDGTVGGDSGSGGDTGGSRGGSGWGGGSRGGGDVGGEGGGAGGAGGTGGEGGNDGGIGGDGDSGNGGCGFPPKQRSLQSATPAGGSPINAQSAGVIKKPYWPHDSHAGVGSACVQNDTQASSHPHGLADASAAPAVHGGGSSGAEPQKKKRSSAPSKYPFGSKHASPAARWHHGLPSSLHDSSGQPSMSTQLSYSAYSHTGRHSHGGDEGEG